MLAEIITVLIVFVLGFMSGRIDRKQRRSKLVKQLWRDLEAAKAEHERAHEEYRRQHGLMQGGRDAT